MSSEQLDEDHVLLDGTPATPGNAPDSQAAPQSGEMSDACAVQVNNFPERALSPMDDRPRQRKMKGNAQNPHAVTASSASSANDHLWLIHHQISCAAHIRAFDSVEALAQRSHELLATVPTKEQLAQLDRGGADGADHSQLLRPLNVRRGGIRKRGAKRSSNSSSKSTHESSGSSSESGASSSSDDDDDTLTQAFWLDVQTSDASQLQKVLRLFPVHQLTVDRILDKASGAMSELDNIEVFASLNYIFAALSCKPLASAVGEDVSDSAAFCDKESSGEVCVSIIAFEDWIVTIHPAPFVGLAELLQRIQAHFNNTKRLSMLQACALDSSQVNGLQTSLMSPAWVLSTLADFVVESFLPDPTKVLSEVDSVDEMVLLIAPDSHNDQADLLKRIALLRRRISSQRAYLFRKEQLVQQLLMPSMRSTFVTRNASIAERYKHTLAQIGHVAERLDAARDILNQANSNFVSGVSMSMSQASTRMNLKMQLLSQVATICLPLNLVAGIFGMNVDIPYAQADGYTDLTAFYVIVGCMGLWLLLMSPPLVRTFIKMRREKFLMRKASQQLQAQQEQ